jgi:hypothetical protein
MREAQIQVMQKQGATRDAILYRQMEFLETRQEAIEAVISVMSWSNRIRFLFAPVDFIRTVDGVHRNLLAKRSQDAAKALEAHKRKPNLILPNGPLVVPGV